MRKMKINKGNWLNEVYDHFYTSIKSPIENIEASIKKEDTMKAILDLGKRRLRAVKKYEYGNSLTLDNKEIEDTSEPIRRVIYGNDEYQFMNLLLKRYDSIFPTCPNQFIVLNSLQEIIDKTNTNSENKIKIIKKDIVNHILNSKELSSDKTIGNLILLCWQVYTFKKITKHMEQYGDDEEEENRYLNEIREEYDPFLFKKIKDISLSDINKKLNPQTLNEFELIKKIYKLIEPSAKEELSSFKKTIEYAEKIYLNPNNKKLEQVKNIVKEVKKKRLDYILYDLGVIKIDTKVANTGRGYFGSWIYLLTDGPTKYATKEIDYYLTKKQEEIIKILFDNKKYNLLDSFFVESIIKNYEEGH